MNHTSPVRMLLPLGYMLAIVGLSSVHGNDSSGALRRAYQWVAPQWQNLLHIPLYGGLVVAWFWALASCEEVHNRIYLSAAITVLFSAFDETYQLSVPGRFGSLTDLALNVMGIALAAAILFRK